MRAMRDLLRRVYYGPSDWLVGRTNARDRRSFGFWTLVLAVVGAFFFGRAVLYVTILSVLALMPNLTAETPVEEEDDSTPTDALDADRPSR